MLEIHPSAVVHPDAVIGDGCEIGPYCLVGGNVALGQGNRLHSHVVIDGLIEKAALRTVLVEFGKVDETAWKSRSLDTERKRSNEAEETFGPYTTKLIHTLNSGNFLRILVFRY